MLFTLQRPKKSVSMCLCVYVCIFHRPVDRDLGSDLNTTVFSLLYKKVEMFLIGFCLFVCSGI